MKNKLLKIYAFFTEKYILTEDEISLWRNIIEKATNGYGKSIKYYEKHPNTLYWPWVSPKLTDLESELLQKIHDKFYGEDYYIDDPISPSQVNFILYNNVKDKVIIPS